MKTHLIVQTQIVPLLIILTSLKTLAAINMKDASYQSSFTDIPEVTRAYNSRSLHTGYFGFGWCSNLEKILDIKSTREITLKDCDLESPFVLKDENNLLKSRTFENPITLERILFRNGIYTYYQKSGDVRLFDRKGLNTHHISDKNKIAFEYQNSRLTQLKTNSGYTLKFDYNDTGQATKIHSNNGLSAIYLYEKINLIQTVDSKELSHLYDYDKLSNLIKVTYPNKSEEQITYNNDHDRVLKIQLPNQCTEYYDFYTKTEDPLYQISTLIRKCDDKIIHQYTYEFWYKTRSDGLKYLERYKINQSKQTIDITYHPYDGHPVRILKNGKDLFTKI